MKQAETKNLTIGTENTQLYHDVGNFAGPSTTQGACLFDPWSFVSKGTLRKERIGNKVTPRGLSIRFWLANKLDRPNLMYRILVVILPRTCGNTVPAYNTIDLFKSVDVGTNNNTVISQVNGEYVLKVLYDKIVRAQSGVSGLLGSGLNSDIRKECHFVKKLWIKAGKGQRTINYLDGGNIHNNNYLAVYVIPYDSYGTLQTDNVASMSYYADLYWKDI